MVATRSARGSRFDVVQRLIAAEAAARMRNPRVLGVMSTPPTITTSTTQPAGMTKGYTVLANPASFQVFGGNPTIYGSNFWQFPCVTLVSGGNVDTTHSATVWRVEMLVDAQKPAFRVLSSTVPYRFIVDGQYVSSGGTVCHLGGGDNYIQLDFGSRAVRRITVESDQAAAFWGCYVGPTEGAYRSEAPTVRGCILGDSITAGTAATRAGDGFASVMADYLGIRDMWQSGSGGTGYLATSSGAGLKLRDRLATDMVAVGADINFWAAGINDRSNSAAAIQAEVIAALAAYRAAIPVAPLIIFGCWPGNNGEAYATTLSTEDAIAAAVTAFADPGVIHIPIVRAADGSPIAGTGTTATPTGTGNNDLYCAAAGTHPNTAGHAWLGRWAASRVITALKSV